MSLRGVQSVDIRGQGLAGLRGASRLWRARTLDGRGEYVGCLSLGIVSVRLFPKQNHRIPTPICGPPDPARQQHYHHRVVLWMCPGLLGRIPAVALHSVWNPQVSLIKMETGVETKAPPEPPSRPPSGIAPPVLRPPPSLSTPGSISFTPQVANDS